MSAGIRRRSLPDSLRWFADKLDTGALSEAERAGVAVILHMLADQVTGYQDHYRPSQCLSNRNMLWETLGLDPDRISRAEFEQHMNAYDHSLAQQQRAIADRWATDGYAAEADALRQGADAIDPEASL